MGALCCCFSVKHPGADFNRPNGGFMHSLLSKYAAILSKEEMPALPIANNGEPSLNSNTEPINTQSATTINPPRTLPSDAHTRPSNLQEDGLAATHENDASQLQTNIEQLRRGDGMVLELVTAIDKSKKCSLESSIGVSKEKFDSRVGYTLASLDDEDVCPTCLEEYSLENPRIVTQCKHHYHLGCIYEWMERSETCPVCGKVMIFDEAS